jgi:hypothetical protein
MSSRNQRAYSVDGGHAAKVVQGGRLAQAPRCTLRQPLMSVRSRCLNVMAAVFCAACSPASPHAAAAVAPPERAAAPRVSLAVSSAPSASAAAPAVSATPTALRLQWVASWEGARPQVFASPDGEFLLSFVGDARFGGQHLQEPAAVGLSTKRGPRSFWLMRLGPDGSVRHLVAAAGQYAWAEGITQLANGDLIAHGVRAGAANDDQLYRFGSDGALRWSRSLGQGVVGAVSVDERGDRIDVKMISGSAEADDDVGVVTHRPLPGRDIPPVEHTFDTRGNAVPVQALGNLPPTPRSLIDVPTRQYFQRALSVDEVNAAVAVPSGNWLVQARYPGLFLAPGVEPSQPLFSGRSFAWLLASFVEARPGTPTPQPRVLDRSADHRGRTASKVPHTPPSVAGLKRAALNAFRAKHYAQACELFAHAQNLRPTDLANLGDLGLCKQRAGDTADALAIDRYAIELAAGDSAEHAKLRHAVYYNLASLDAKKPLSFAEKACTHLASDTPSCKKLVYVCGIDGTYGMDTRVGITTFTAARFALTSTAADASDLDPLTWPTLGADAGTTSDQDGAASYDVSLRVDRDQRDGNYNTVSEPTASCEVIYSDGCSGRVALVCEWSDATTRAEPERKIVELALDPD